jgi:predicted cation transporter
MFVGLGVILLLVLVLPFMFKQVEHNLEVFLFIMGLAASLISGELGKELIIKALEEPFMIASAVLVAGILFKLLQKRISGAIGGIQQRIPAGVFFFLIVAVLGLASSIITAIIASLVLVEIVNALKLDRKSEITLDIIACFSIGLGAALTPIGEPLATIAISKLNADFWYLLRNLGAFIIPGIIALALLAAFYIKPEKGKKGLDKEQEEESYKDVVIRAVKVYLFVMALVFLGEGFKPAIDRYVLGLGSQMLYWLNMVSAVLDNATLTAAEISDKMAQGQIVAILMGLLISGGMLIPGNIPNIISASKLKIGSKEWARLGVPLGLAIMLIYYVLLFFVVRVH